MAADFVMWRTAALLMLYASAFGTPRERIAQGFGFLSDDRKAEGLALTQSLVRNATLARLDTVARHERGRRELGIDVDPVLVLPPRDVDALAEVSLSIQQADADHRQSAIGRRLQDVAGKYAKSAGVDRE